MNKINIQGSILKALAITMPIYDARVNLNGIQVEWSPHGVLMITTDGHRLSIARIKYIGEEFPSFIVPAAMLGFVKSTKIMYGIFCESEKVTMEIPGKPNVTMPAVDGKYPNWRRVMPATLTDEPAIYNLQYLGDLDTARKLLGGDPYERTLVMNGPTDGAIGRITEDFFVLVMPVRTKASYVPNLEVEEWAR